MADGVGSGDGVNDLGSAGVLAEPRPDARRRSPGLIEIDEWPAPGSVLRTFALTVLAIVLLGVILTTINR
jgi:hypothetical protein